MKIIVAPGWEEYKLLDSGNKKRLEKFTSFTLSRPDPQCLWQPGLSQKEWETVDAVFSDNEEKGNWSFPQQNRIPKVWKMRYNNLQFALRLTPFKHTGVFPEQHVMWEWMEGKIKDFKSESQTIKVLNLFGYTGAASLVCAAAGAQVTHVDASYPTIGWARENQKLSGLDSAKIRWILDDASKFVQREIKRGVRYEGIIMDPPVFGHGPNGERWEFNTDFPILLNLCKQVLAEQPVFILINAYAVSSSAIMLQNVLEDMMSGFGGTIEAGELCLQEEKRKRLLSTGIFARWQK